MGEDDATAKREVQVVCSHLLTALQGHPVTEFEAILARARHSRCCTDIRWLGGSERRGKTWMRSFQASRRSGFVANAPNLASMVDGAHHSNRRPTMLVVVPLDIVQLTVRCVFAMSGAYVVRNLRRISIKSPTPKRLIRLKTLYSLALLPQ